jgi:hypothetical protein
LRAARPTHRILAKESQFLTTAIFKHRVKSVRHGRQFFADEKRALVNFSTKARVIFYE